MIGNLDTKLPSPTNRLYQEATKGNAESTSRASNMAFLFQALFQAPLSNAQHVCGRRQNSAVLALKLVNSMFESNQSSNQGSMKVSRNIPLYIHRLISRVDAPFPYTYKSSSLSVHLPSQLCSASDKSVQSLDINLISVIKSISRKVIEILGALSLEDFLGLHLLNVG